MAEIGRCLPEGKRSSYWLFPSGKTRMSVSPKFCALIESGADNAHVQAYFLKFCIEFSLGVLV